MTDGCCQISPEDAGQSEIRTKKGAVYSWCPFSLHKNATICSILFFLLKYPEGVYIILLEGCLAAFGN